MPMIEFSLYDPATGKIVSTKSVASQAELLKNIPEHLAPLPGAFPGSEWYVTGGFLRHRPKITPMVDMWYDLSILPAGTILHVTDEEGVTTEVPAQTDILELVDAGTWRIRSEAPFPYVDFDTTITVTPEEGV